MASYHPREYEIGYEVVKFECNGNYQMDSMFSSSFVPKIVLNFLYSSGFYLMRFHIGLTECNPFYR